MALSSTPHYLDVLLFSCFLLYRGGDGNSLAKAATLVRKAKAGASEGKRKKTLAAAGTASLCRGSMAHQLTETR